MYVRVKLPHLNVAPHLADWGDQDASAVRSRGIRFFLFTFFLKDGPKGRPTTASDISTPPYNVTPISTTVKTCP
jgi:hypothetical protein